MSPQSKLRLAAASRWGGVLIVVACLAASKLVAGVEWEDVVVLACVGALLGFGGKRAERGLKRELATARDEPKQPTG